MDLVSRAHSFAADAYTRHELAHPEEVAAIVRAAGGGDDLRAAALLHDLVEDTDVELAGIAAEFGPQIADYVAALTEDESIADYGERKHEHRLRARDAGREVALLFVADKLSNARLMQRGQKQLDPKKIEHYRLTLELMEEAYPDLPLLDELRGAILLIEPVTQPDGHG